MTEELKLYATPMPTICPECRADIARLVAENTGLDQLYHHCPHSDTLVHMRLEQHQGRPAITQWILQGPLPQEKALEIIKALGADMGAQVSLLTGSERVN